MNEKLDKFNIIASLRKEKGYSQSELAERLKVSRQTLSKYENNTEGIYAELIVGLSQIFGVKYEYIIENKPLAATKYELEHSEYKQTNTTEQKVRLKVSEENMLKFKQVFLYVIQQVGAKPNIGQAALLSLLYFIDLDYYEKYETQLMGLKYQKQESGSFIIGFADFIEYMSSERIICVIKTGNFTLDTTKYLPMVSPDLTLLNAQEIKHIDATLERLSDKKAKELLSLLEEDTPWITANFNELINYEPVFYRNNITSVRSYA